MEELRRDLRIKSQELEAKNAAANDKLKKMVKDQQEAEKKKVHTGIQIGYFNKTRLSLRKIQSNVLQ